MTNVEDKSNLSCQMNSQKKSNFRPSATVIRYQYRSNFCAYHYNDVTWASYRLSRKIANFALLTLCVGNPSVTDEKNAFIVVVVKISLGWICVHLDIFYGFASLALGKWYDCPATPLQWRHIECHCISNHRRLDFLLNSGTDQRTHQSPASLAFVREIHRWPVNSPHKGPVTRKMFPFDNVIMIEENLKDADKIDGYLTTTAETKREPCEPKPCTGFMGYTVLARFLCKTWWRHQMQTFIRVTGPLCGEFTGHRWIPHTKASDAELWCFLWSTPEWMVK